MFIIILKKDKHQECIIKRGKAGSLKEKALPKYLKGFFKAIIWICLNFLSLHDITNCKGAVSKSLLKKCGQTLQAECNAQSK